MRAFAVGALIAAVLVVAGCSRPQPPVGRWEGGYESADSLVAARVEINKDGRIYLSAPDALNLSPDPAVHAAFRQRLIEDLSFDWPMVTPRQMDFDGSVFRKPGGVAPQMEWKNGRLTVILYPGTRPEIRIRMHEVQNYTSDPWSE